MKELSKKALLVKESSTLLISAKTKAMQDAGQNVIAFTAGEPDFDTPEHIKEAAFAAARTGFTKYTATPGILPLREAIVKKLHDENGLKYSHADIVVSNGAKHALSNALTAILNDGDECIILAPYWLTYPELVVLNGGVPIVVNSTHAQGYVPSIEDIEAAITPRTKAIILNSPNNPSGAVYPRTLLEQIAVLVAKHDLYAITDEIYEKLIYNPDTPHYSIAQFCPEAFERTIYVNGYSKSYSMTGWRVGYTAAVGKVGEVIRNIQSQQTSNICTLTQRAALAAQTGPQDAVWQMRAAFDTRMKLMYGLVSKVQGFAAAKPDGAFYVFIDISELLGKKCGMDTISSAADFAEYLLGKQQVAIIPCADFGCENHIRLSYATSEANITEGCHRIADFVSKLT